MTSDRRIDKSAERIVRLLLDLQIGQAWDPIQLAQELGVSRRTIFRDIATLRRAGVPIQFDVQQNTYRLRQPNAKWPRGLSAQEIGILAIAARSSSLNAVEGLRKLIYEGIAKLTAGLSDQNRAQMESLFATWVDPLPAPRNGQAPDFLTAILDAFAAGKRSD
jgi:predicted DNA-binding transcriptional regulator YafY